MTHPDGPAFPWGAINTQPGLTKREYFAAMAMQGLIQLAAAAVRTTDAEAIDNLAGKMGCDLAPAALIIADSLIAELSKEKK